jgi:hypothetical protein
MTKTMAPAAFLFETLEHSYFEFVSSFDFDIEIKLGQRTSLVRQRTSYCRWLR